MYGIVTIAEGEAGAQVLALWEELSKGEAWEAVGEMSVPHLSYHVAETYRLAAVEKLLERVAGETAPFRLPMASIGVVCGPHHVVYLTAVRTPALSALHEALWDGATEAGSDIVPRYESATWMPHVTLGNHASMVEWTPELARRQGAGRLPREIVVDNVALIEEVPGGHEVIYRSSFH